MASVVATFRTALASACSLLLVRAEFAAAELSEAGASALRWLLIGLLASALLMLALAAVTATIVLALWERLGWYPMGVLALIYAGAAWWVVVRLLRQIRASPPLLSRTFAELAKDREALFGREDAASQGPSP